VFSALPYALCAFPLLYALYPLLSALCPMPYAPCSMRIVLLTFGRFLSPVKEDGMMAPRNAYPACPHAPREVHISDSAAYFTGEGQNDRTGACPIAPKDGTGVGSGNPTGVESFLFLPRSMLHAPCLLLHWGSMHHNALYYALCPLRHALSLCPLLYALYPMLYALCSLPSAPCLLSRWGSIIL